MRRAISVATLAAGLLATPFLPLATPARAASLYWNVLTNGQWENPDNWAVGSQTGTTSTAPPSGSDNVYIGNNGAAWVDGISAVSSGLFVGLSSGSGTLNIENSGLVSANSVTIGSAATGGGTVNIESGGVLATGGVTKSSGTAALNFDGGTLRATAGNTAFLNGFASGDITFAAGGATIDSNGFNIGTGSPLGGVGGLTKTGAGTLTLSGVNTYTGATTVGGGTLALSGAGAIATSSGVDVAGGATFDIGATTDGATIQSLSGAGAVVLGARTLTVNSSASTGFGGVISGTGGLTKQGAGTLTLSGTNSYTGATTIGAGTLALSGAGKLGTGNLTINGGALDLGGTSQAVGALSGAVGGFITNSGPAAGVLTVNQGAAGTYAGVIEDGTGGVSLIKQGGGALTLSGTSTYTGGTTIKAGSLNVSAGANLGRPTSKVTLDGGTLYATTSFAMSQDIDVASSGTIQVSGNGGSSDASMTLTVTGTIDGPGALTKTGYGTLQIGDGGTSGWLLTDVIGSSAAYSTLAFNRSDDVTYDGVISGGIYVKQMGSGTTTLTGANTYTFGTIITNGMLALSGAGKLGGGGVLTINGGALDLGGTSQTVGTFSGTGGRITNSGPTAGVLTVNQSAAGGYAGAIEDGAGGVSLIKQGGGALTLSGTSTYTGGTTIKAGSLNVSAAANLGGPTSKVTLDGGTLYATTSFAMSQDIDVTSSGTIQVSGNNGASDASMILTVTGTIDGPGALTKTGYGVLQIGDGGTSGWLLTDVIGSSAAYSTLAFNRSDDVSYDGVISGGVYVKQMGSGTLTLTGANTYTWDTIITNGTLRIDGSIAGGPVTVNTGGTLAGAGSIGGAVTVNNGGTLRGAADSTLTMASLKLNASSQVNVALGAPSTAGLFNVTGNLTLDGVLNVTNAGGFGNGLYRLFDYGGTLTDNGLDIGNVPVGLTASDWAVVTATAKQVDLLVGVTPGAFVYWDGAHTTANGSIDGGTGTWSATGTNWTDEDGTANGVFDPDALLLFAGTGGTVTVSAGGGALALGEGVQFANNGYTVQGNGLALTRPATTFRVGDGTAAGASIGATIASVLGGTGGLDKTDLGKLTLSGANSYTGATTVSGGTLALSGAGAIATSSGVSVAGGATFDIGATTGGATIQSLSGAGAVVLGAKTLTVNSSASTGFGGVISGTGGLTKQGAGTLTLSGTSTYTGTTTISAGTLALSGVGKLGGGGLTINGGALDLGGTSQAVGVFSGTGGRITNSGLTAGVLTVNQSANNTYAGVIEDGTGGVSLVKAGANSLTLTGSSSYTGGTTIKAGSLNVGADANLGGPTGKVTLDGGILAASTSFATGRDIAVISGGTIQTDTGVLTVTGTINGPGALTKTGAGTLQIGDGGTSGWLLTNVIGNAGSLAFNHSDALNYGGVISGSIGVTQMGAGTTTFTGANTYTGGTTINAGKLRIDGSIAGGAVTVNSGGTLAGAGTIGGAVTVNNGGTLQGAAGATLRMASLKLNASSQVNVALGTPSTAGLFNVTGNLTLDGVLNVTDAGGFGNGLYRLFDYGGTLTNNGLDIGNVPVGLTAGDLAVVTATAKQVDLLVGATPGAFVYWDGANTTANGSIDGGAGTWSATGTNWTDGDGTANGVFDPDALLLFTGTGGTVMVSAGGGALALGEGVQFANNGYTVQGNGLTLTQPATTFRVGDGTAAGASIGATIASVLGGTGGLNKTDLGKLTLTGANSYTGATTVSGGTLALSGAGAIATSSGVDVAGGATFDIGATTGGATIQDLSGAGAVVLGARTLTVNSSASTGFGGVISGTGGLTKQGAGTLTLSGANTYTGGTTIDSGTLKVDGSIAVSNLTVVKDSATLTGTGKTGSVTVNSGGTLAGAAGDNLTINGDLTLQSGSHLDVTLGAPYADATAAAGTQLFTVTGVLTSNGSAVDVHDASGFGPGLYRLIDYSAGSLADGSSFTTGTTPTGYTLTVTTADAGYIDLLVGATSTGSGGPFRFWDGAHFVSNGQWNGGDGTWNATNTNWANDAHDENGVYDPAAQLIFTGTAGTVTVDAGGVSVGAGGLQFVTNDYIITGGGITISVTTPFAVNSGVGATIASAITGTGSLTKTGAGALTLSGNNTYTGGTTIDSGTLKVDGSIAVSNLTVVKDSGTLTGTGKTGAVTVNGGGTLAGAAGGNLTISGDLTLQSGSHLDVTLGAPYADATAAAGTQLFTVTGVLTSNGSAVDVHDAGGFGGGLYRLIDYSAGSLADGSSFTTGTTPTGYTLTVTTADAGYIDLLVGATSTGSGSPFRFWDGANFISNGQWNGGSGTWNTTNTNWANDAHDENGVYDPAAQLIFTGAAGTVTVDAGGGAVTVDGGMQFAVDGYSVQGDGLAIDGVTTVRVGDGTSAGAAYTAIIDSAISGDGGIEKTDLGTLILTGNNTYTGDTTIDAGTLEVSGTLGGGDYAGNIVNDGALIMNQNANQTLSGDISGSGSLTKDGDGTLTLSGDNTYTGDTTINSGTLAGDIASGSDLTVLSGGAYDDLGSARTVITLNGDGDIINNGGLTAQDGAFAGVISGDGSLTKTGDDTLTLSGNNNYTGDTTIDAGTLKVDGSIAASNLTTVNDGGTLTGTGTTGEVTVKDGGTLAGVSGGKLTINGDLTLQSGSHLDVALGAPPADPVGTQLFTVNGNLTLDGTLNVSDAGGFGDGLYRLIDYSGVLTDNTLDIGITPDGYTASDLAVQTAEANHINLVVSASSNPGLFNWWNGAGAATPGTLVGGGGTWSDANTNWTNVSANANGIYDRTALLIFAGAGGTVTVDAGGGALPVGVGMQFAVDGYSVQGDGLAIDGVTTVRVGDGTSAGAAYTAIIDSAISGDGGIEKTDLGTLILTGVNTYSGVTTINAGTLALSGGGSITVSSDVKLATGATFDISETTAGARIMALDNTAAGQAGTVNLGGQTLTVAGGGAFGGVIQGEGGLTKDGAGTLTLTGANTYSGLTEVREGTLAVNGAGRISDTLALYGGTTFRAGDTTVNYLSRLDVYGSANWTGDLNMAGRTMNFYVPETMENGGAMLHVYGVANIAGSTVNVGIAGDNPLLQPGNQVVLIDATLGLNGKPVNPTSDSQWIMRQGSTIDYTFLLSETGDKLVATIAGASASEESKSLSEGYLGGAGLLNQTADFVADKGVEQAVEAAGGKTSGAGKQARANTAGGYGLGTFGTMSGGWNRYNTGSHVDMSGFSLMAGLAWGNDLDPGRLTLGAFFEYGNGWYDTYNSFANAADIHGKGNIYHLGGGILGRLDFNDRGPGNFYTEAGLRAGNVKNDYKNGDFTGGAAGYDSSSVYYGIHAALGHIWNLTEKTSFDLYGKYFWTRQNGDSVRLSTGELVRFDSVDSHRLRLGGRVFYAVNDLIKPYAGLAYEQEFDGKARATTGGLDINAPSLQGGTGIGEIGLAVKASKIIPLSVDLGVQGYAGMREGFTVSAQARYDF